MGRKGKVGKQNSLARLLFLAYVALMIWLLFGQRMGEVGNVAAEGGYNLNLIPFKTIKMYFDMVQNTQSAYWLRHSFNNLAGNVIMFLPLGFFLPNIWQSLRSIFKTGLLAIALIAIVEAIQYVTDLGSCDIDDLLLNMVGVLIGYFCWKLIAKLRR